MSAGKSYMKDQDRGKELVDLLFRVNNVVTNRLVESKENGWIFVEYPVKDLKAINECLRNAAHRLSFLEMVVKGLAYMEQHDAQGYAKFVEKKRSIEDMDIEELRKMLR